MGNNPLPINQLASNSASSRMDCVPASIIWCGRDLVGGDYWNNVTAEQLRAEAYPNNSDPTGPTSARDFAAVCAAHGLQLTPYDSPDMNALVADLRADLASGARDALVTMPSEWGSVFPYAELEKPPFSTHVAAAAYIIPGAGDGLVRLMNPWGGFWQDVDDTWLTEHLCFGEVWNAAAAAAAPGGNTVGWTVNGDGTANDAAGHHVGEGMAALIEQHFPGVDGLTGEEYYDATDSTCALANGVVLHYSKTSNSTDMNGAVVVQALLAQVADLQAKVAAAAAEDQGEASTPADPKAEALAAAVRALFA